LIQPAPTQGGEAGHSHTFYLGSREVFIAFLVFDLIVLLAI
jgi:hypothetical protein